MIKHLFILLLIPTFSACSVVMAASGEKEPDYSKLVVGAKRSIIEQELGSPKEVVSTAKGERVTYRYTLGNKPAPLRALGFLVLDIFTLAFAEYILFPLEISNSGDAYQAQVEYDTQGVATEISDKEEITAE